MKQEPASIRVFRAVLDAEDTADRIIRTDTILRPPLKVPYVVDNLWEWVRPEKFPCRRFAAFASPQIQLAREQGAKEAKVYRVEFRGNYTIAQLKGYRNAKHHPDCISLPIFLFEKLGDGWLRSSLESKNEIGRLWIPTLSKAEVESLFREVPALGALRESLRTSIRFWEDVELIEEESREVDPEGELFFEAPDGYYLRPLTEG
jgi:hypothetical protein